MFSVKEVSKQVNKSDRTIYRLIKKLPSDIQNEVIKNNVGVTVVSDRVRQYIVDYYSKNPSSFSYNSASEGVKDSVNSNKELEFLKSQLYEKDKQIEYLQKHIEKITKLNENMQVLLQNQQQIAFLPSPGSPGANTSPKSSFFGFFKKK